MKFLTGAKQKNQMIPTMDEIPGFVCCTGDKSQALPEPNLACTVNGDS